MFEISKESKCVPYGEIISQVDERKDCFLLTGCTCNSHRLSEPGMEAAWPQCLISSNDETAGGHFPAGPKFDIETLMAYPAQSPCDKDRWDFSNVNHLFKSNMMASLCKCYNFTHSWLSSTETKKLRAAFRLKMVFVAGQGILFV